MKPMKIAQQASLALGLDIPRNSVLSIMRDSKTYLMVYEEMKELLTLYPQMTPTETAHLDDWLSDRNNRRRALAKLILHKDTTKREQIIAIKQLHDIEEDYLRGDLEKFRIRVEQEIKILMEEGGCTRREALEALAEDIKCKDPKLYDRMMLTLEE